jgi:hypothetical protein
MLGQVEGHRKQEKPRMRWLDSIKEATGLRLEDLTRGRHGAWETDLVHFIIDGNRN